MYFVYILKCNDDTLYTGVTTNLARRVKEHNSSALGAKYTKPLRPKSRSQNKETQPFRKTKTGLEIPLDKGGPALQEGIYL